MFQPSIFRGYVSFRGGRTTTKNLFILLHSEMLYERNIKSKKNEVLNPRICTYGIMAFLVYYDVQTLVTNCGLGTAKCYFLGTFCGVPTVVGLIRKDYRDPETNSKSEFAPEN